MKNMSVHSRIRRGREALGLNVQQFADRLGVTRGAVQQWEKEGGTAPKRNNQQAVADLLGLSVAALMHPGDDFIEMERVQPALLPPAAPAPPAADPIAAEVVSLLSQMSPAGRAEALEYVRYLAKRHSAFFSEGEWTAKIVPFPRHRKRRE